MTGVLSRQTQGTHMCVQGKSYEDTYEVFYNPRTDVSREINSADTISDFHPTGLEISFCLSHPSTL